LIAKLKQLLLRRGVTFMFAVMLLLLNVAPHLLPCCASNTHPCWFIFLTTKHLLSFLLTCFILAAVCIVVVTVLTLTVLCLILIIRN
jgi:hypothetical protein